MLNVRLAGGHLYGEQLFAWLSLVVSLIAYFCAVLFMPRHKKWRGIMLYPPTFRVSVSPSVRPSVRPSAVHHSCPLHNFVTVGDNFTNLAQI